MANLYHPDLGDVRYELREVSEDPEAQVSEVIGMMRDYAETDSRTPVLRDDLRRAAADSRPGSGIPEAVFWHVKRRIAFSTDGRIAAPLEAMNGSGIPIVEALIRPVDMAAMCDRGGCRRVGDCDDFAMYAAALLLAAGIPCAFVTVRADPADPGRYSHVYVAAYGPDGRMALDTSHGEYPGWEVPAVYGRKEWPLGERGAGRVLLAAAAALCGWLWWTESRGYKGWARSAA